MTDEQIDVPQVTIGVSTYRRPGLLKECLQSVLAQDFKHFEVIVGNNDFERLLNLEEIGIHDPRIRILNHGKNLGPIRNWNSQLAAARGTYFCWLNDDDRIEPGFLEALVTCHRRFPDIEVSYSRYHKGEWAGGGAIPEGCQLEREEFLERFIFDEVPVVGMYGCFKTETLRQLGGLQQLGQQQNSVGADHLLAVAVASRGRLGWVDAPLVYFRPHDASYSNSTGNLKAYREAYTDLLRYAEKILTANLQKSDARRFQEGLVLLCCRHYCGVMRRSQMASWGEFGRFMDVFKRWLRELRSSGEVWRQFKSHVQSTLELSTLRFRQEDGWMDSLRGRIAAFTI